MANKENTKLKEESLGYPNWVLTDRQIYDLEMILNGGFSPLSGFLCKEDYESVVNNLRLDDGSLWPIPINLDVTKEYSQSIDIGSKITLKDKEGFSLAVMEVYDIWEPDRSKEGDAGAWP